MAYYAIDGVSEDAEILTDENMQAMTEMFLLDDLAKCTLEERNQFLASEECQILEAKGAIGRKTIVKLDKTDDLERRINLACLQLSRSKNDPLWAKLEKNKMQYHKLMADIRRKYQNAGKRLAVASQKAYLRINPVNNFFGR